ncbi:protein phosphatase 2C domain-containing protein [Mycoplasma sp. CSL7475-4]|uniref:PP2C family protein-serine/threonine phosphatase n=1 Tax=Mycoplasma sp. CSL7475-4 TaxID=2973942 RepID=UPI00216AEE22|nr:protein phosphatase 2C domain-containing protein [Mycoplasma sp. CSL7475-4]MCS4536692.1 protein phosphatase 2C domain-containing protein [Mycoplasma sp. CSL7475-4]
MNNFAQLSVKGNVRNSNQDAVGIFHKDNIHMLLLCDGMGGHYGGSKASNITVNTFSKKFAQMMPLEKFDVNSVSLWFKSVVNDARLEMKTFANVEEAYLDMGTTVTAAIYSEVHGFLYIFNIGDSRTYILTKGGDLKQITVDHNLYNRLINEENYTELKARNVKYNMALTSALGPLKKTKIEIFDLSASIKAVHSILCTSDGVHNFLEKPSIELIIKKEIKAQKIVEVLVQEALDNRSTDNASAVYASLSNIDEWSK